MFIARDRTLPRYPIEAMGSSSGGAMLLVAMETAFARFLTTKGLIQNFGVLARCRGYRFLRKIGDGRNAGSQSQAKLADLGACPRSRYAPGVNCQRRRISLEGSVQQVHLWQDENQSNHRQEAK